MTDHDRLEVERRSELDVNVPWFPGDTSSTERCRAGTLCGRLRRGSRCCRELTYDARVLRAFGTFAVSCPDCLDVDGPQGSGNSLELACDDYHRDYEVEPVAEPAPRRRMGAWMLLAGALVACSAAPKYSAPEVMVRDEPHSDPAALVFDVAPELAAPFEVAAQRWRDAIGAHIETAPEGVEVRFVPSAEVQDQGAATGVERPSMRLVHIHVNERYQVKKAWLVDALTHELGHALMVPALQCQDHPSDGGQLMSFHIPAAAPLTTADLEWVCAAHECERFVPEAP